MSGRRWWGSWRKLSRASVVRQTQLKKCSDWPYSFYSIYVILAGVKDALISTKFGKVLAKRARKSTQVCKTRTCVRTCDGLQTDSQVSRLASSHKSEIVVDCKHIQLTCDQLVSTCGGQMVKNLRRLAFELDQSQRKWVAKRNASWTQVDNVLINT